MSQTIPVKCVAGRPVSLDGGRTLAHRERGDAPDTDVTRDQIDAGLLIEVTKPAPSAPRTTTKREG